MCAIYTGSQKVHNISLEEFREGFLWEVMVQLTLKGHREHRPFQTRELSFVKAGKHETHGVFG